MIRPIHTLRFARFVLPALAFLLPAAMAQEASKNGSPTKEQTDKINALKTAEEAVKLAESFFNEQAIPAAATAIEKACKLDPNLLTDSKVLSPKPWNDYWFAHRGTLQERALKRDDAAGRVKIAKWLHQAGATTAVGELLAAAIKIDKNNKEAQDLAKQWGVLGGPAIQFDFSLALTQPLLQASYKDENQDLAIRKDRTLLLIPVSYSLSESRLLINKMLLKVVSDDGKPCMPKGLVVVEGSAGGGPGADAGPDLKPLTSDPLWDRLQIDRKADRTGYELTPFRAPRITPGQRGAANRAANAYNKPQTKPAEGHAAFLVEIPQAYKYLDCEYRGCPPLRIEAAFVTAMSVQARDATPQQREAAVTALLPYMSSKDGPIATAAARKLASIKSTLATGSAPKADAVQQKIDAALLNGMVSPDRIARQAAFDALVLGVTNPTESSFAGIRACTRTDALLALIEQAKAILAQPPAEGRKEIPPQALDTAEKFAADLPPSPAPPAVFGALVACLNNKTDAVRKSAVDLLMTDGTRQSAATLAKAPPEAVAAVLERLPKAKDELKAALLRILLIHPDTATLTKALSACEGLTLVVSQEDDPLISALANVSSPQATQQLLAVLSRSDLSAVANSNRLQSILKGLAEGQSPPAVRKGMLALSLAQFHLPYEAPIRRGPSGQPTAASGFEAVLASLAINGDAEASRVAAEALFNAGRINGLRERMRQSPGKNQQQFVERLAQNKKLYDREALASFVASQIADAQVAPVAVKALAIMEKNVDAKQRWRMNLGIKQAIEARQILDLTAGDEMTSQAAIEVLARIAMMPSTLESEFKSAGDRGAREQRLTTMDTERAAKPAGQFASIVYLDLKAPEPTAAPTGQAKPGPKLADRYNVPLIGPAVTLQLQGQNVRAMADGRAIDMPPTSGSAAPGGPRSITINVASLLRPLLSSSQAEKEQIAGQLDLLALNEPKLCELKYEQLGTWAGEFMFEEKGQEADKPYRLTGGKVVFEPLPAN